MSRVPDRRRKLGAARLAVAAALFPGPVGGPRIDGTLPGPEGRWRWLGMRFYMLP
jgi:hypothetical protein